MISLQEVSKTYAGRSRPAVDEVSLEIQNGELVVLLGESGSGKTSTLKMINRLLRPDSGQILVEDQDIRSVDRFQLRRRVGYVFQNIGLFPHMTVEENLGIVPSLLGWKKDRIRQRVLELLELLGLEDPELRRAMPSSLSGGQQQRVGLGRALAARPAILLMDEPFGALDPVTRIELQREFKKLHQKFELTTLLVTHDVVEGLLLADRVGVMKEGKLLQVGTPEEMVRKSDHPYVERLMDSPQTQYRQLEQVLEPES